MEEYDRCEYLTTNKGLMYELLDATCDFMKKSEERVVVEYVFGDDIHITEGGLSEGEALDYFRHHYYSQGETPPTEEEIRHLVEKCNDEVAIRAALAVDDLQYVAKVLNGMEPVQASQTSEAGIVYNRAIYDEARNDRLIVARIKLDGILDTYYTALREIRLTRMTEDELARINLSVTFADYDPVNIYQDIEPVENIFLQQVNGLIGEQRGLELYAIVAATFRYDTPLDPDLEQFRKLLISEGVPETLVDAAIELARAKVEAIKTDRQILAGTNLTEPSVDELQKLIVALK